MNNNRLNITHVRINLHNNQNEKFKAYADITIAGLFMIHGFKIREGEKGLFLTMPSKLNKNKEYTDIAHPIDATMKDELEAIVLAAYKEKLEASQEA